MSLQEIESSPNIEVDNRYYSSTTSAAIAICIFLAINNVIYNALPVILALAAESLNLKDDQIGFLGSIFLLGTTLSNMSSILWVRAVNWRVVLALSTAGSASLIFLSTLTSYQGLLIVFSLAGVCSGSALACVMCSLSGFKNPEKVYGVGLGIQVTLAGLLILGLEHPVISKLGFTGLSYCLVALFAVAMLAIPLFPKEGAQLGTSQGSITSKDREPSLSFFRFIPLLGILIYFLGQTAIWAFLQRIGEASAIDSNFVAKTIAAVLIICSVGAFLASALGERIGRILPIFISTVVFILALFSLHKFGSTQSYVLSVLLYSCAWNFALPFQLLAVTRVDKSGRLASLIPSFQNIGGTLGPALAGIIIVSQGFASLYMMAATTAILSLVIFWFADKQSTGVQKVDE